MGVLRLNGKAYGGGIDVIEVTQAQYNALPESKLSDDILYVISDSVNGSDGYPPLIYSTEEREVGVWTDGKPLYQKTLVLNNLSVMNNQWAKTNESATNIEMIVGGFLVDNQSPSQTFQCDIGVDGGKVAVLTWFVGNSARTMSYLTFRYTKTTDTKGSGRWTTQGTLAQHYSTTERLIGTWIDGKPLYEKTIVANSTDISGTIQHIDVSALNIDTFVKIDGTFNRITAGSAHRIYPFNAYESSSYYSFVRYLVEEKEIGFNITMASGQSTTQQVFTLQYTKTTD